MWPWSARHVWLAQKLNHKKSSVESFFFTAPFSGTWGFMACGTGRRWTMDQMKCRAISSVRKRPLEIDVTSAKLSSQSPPSTSYLSFGGSWDLEPVSPCLSWARLSKWIMACIALLFLFIFLLLTRSGEIWFFFAFDPHRSQAHLISPCLPLSLSL